MGSYGNANLTDCQPVSTAAALLRAPRQSPPSCRGLLVPAFSIPATAVGVRWYRTVVWFVFA